MATKEAVHRGCGGRFSKRVAKKGAKIPKAGGLRTSQKTVTDNKRKTPPENENRSEAEVSAEDESEESEEAVENEEEDVPIQQPPTVAERSSTAATAHSSKVVFIFRVTFS